MNILLHTIALEPARWTPIRGSQDLVDLLAPIRAAGFLLLEVYEPPLALAPDEVGTLEFVPSGVGAPEKFDLGTSLGEASGECAWALAVSNA